MPDYDAIVDEYVKVTGVVLVLDVPLPGKTWAIVREETGNQDVDILLFSADDPDPAVPCKLPMRWRRTQKDLKIDNAYTTEYNQVLALPHGSQIFDLITLTAMDW